MRLYATVAAALGWLGLVVQFVLTMRSVDGRSGLMHFTNFFSYFTILSNILAAAMFTCVAADGRSAFARFFTRPSVMTAIAVYMTLTGLIYTLILREPLTGLHVWTNAILHYLMPVVVLVFWVRFVPKGTLATRGIPTMLAFPILYAAYALVRGPLVSWYPYPFIDAGVLTGGRLITNILMVALAFVIVAFAYVTFDKVLSGGPASQPSRR